MTSPYQARDTVSATNATDDDTSSLYDSFDGLDVLDPSAAPTRSPAMRELVVAGTTNHGSRSKNRHRV